MQGVTYIEQLKSRFAENSGKLFFVDGFKNRAFSAVKEIFSSFPESLLCVVRNQKVAKQVKAKLCDNASIIASSDDFKKLYDAIGSEKLRYQQLADKFKKNYPNLIITLETGSGSPVLHSKLCSCEGKAGEYTGGENAAYAISDFLTDAAYSAIIVDDVYDMFCFEEVDSDSLAEKKPQDHERVDLMGKSYFTDVAHSYKRLQRLVDSADQAIIISNTVVGKEIISFYAGVSLINSAFSYKAAKKNAKARAMDYDDEVDRIFDSISYSQSDETIQSMCLQRAKGRKQIIPGDIDKLGEYSSGNLNFMTKEEIFLRALSALTAKHKGLSNDAAINLLEDDQTLANTVCDLFFNDTLKGDIESSTEFAHIAKMSEENLVSFFEIFNKYGVYCSTGTIGDKCTVYRIYHDDSGFEDLIRRSSESFDRNENAMCASHMGDDISYKCVATKSLLESGAVKLPLLIVTAKSASGIVSSLCKIVEHSVSAFEADRSKANAGEILVVDYNGFESIANDIQVSSVVFFDAIADISKLDTLVKKAINLSDNVNTALLITYDNISGILVDLWQERWLGEKNDMISIQNQEVYIKGDRPLDYVYISEKMDSIYTSFKNIIDGVGNVNAKALAESFSGIISEFTLGRAAFVSDIEEDLGYFAKISPYYAGTFANCVSIGVCEREFFAEKIPVDSTENKKKKKSKKKKNSVYESIPEPSKVAFNICSKHLHNACDIKFSDCYSCPLRNKNMANSSASFKTGVEGYFEKGAKIMKKIHDDRIERMLDDTISTRSDSNSDILSCIDRLQASWKEYKNIVKSIPENSKAPYYIGYSIVFEIKEAIQSVHFEIFKKYYEQITDIFEKATNEMKKSFDAVGQGAKSSLHTL